MSPDHSRHPSSAALRRKALSILTECLQIKIDVDHWNNHVRRPHEKPVEFDPDGHVRAARAAAEKALANLR